VRENYGLQIWFAFIEKPVRMSGQANELIGRFDEIPRSHGGVHAENFRSFYQRGKQAANCRKIGDGIADAKEGLVRVGRVDVYPLVGPPT